MSKKTKLAILISGRGSNMQALIEACKQPDYPAEVVLVISNKADAMGMEIAKASNIKTLLIDHTKYPSRELFDQAIDKEIVAACAELVCLAGFMRLVSKWFAHKWGGKLLNTHPSLLPSFRGINAQEQAIAAGVRITGCTIHFVIPEMDAGPPIVQAALPIFTGETAPQLTERLLKLEHQCYVQAVKMVITGQAKLVNGKAALTQQKKTDNSIISPELD